METGHWIITEEFNPTEYFGFVYKITRKDTGRSYIGRKQFMSYRRKKIAGRKNRKRHETDSGWRKYTGSCDELNEELQKLGEEAYRFEILKLCETKSDLGYSETKIQFELDVLNSVLEDGSRAFYNSNIMIRWFYKE